ncbi:MAG: molybdopterin oxidoreductase family protein, partial [Sphingomonas bacterium]|nr:molybdopterin oxidoreductase family protein [Sphingomonas bacterium]
KGARLFDLRAHAAIGNAAYDAMAPFRWGGQPFADGRYPTADGRARLVPVVQARQSGPLPLWPMTLNTGRYRDQWHTMTRTGLSPKLARHREEPLVEIHPRDAAGLGIGEGDLTRVSTAQGESLFRARLSDGQRRGEMFVPIHWTDRQSSGGRAGLLPRPLADPHSGQPGFKSTPARAEKIEVDWRGFLLVRGEAPRTPSCLWTTRIAVPGGTLYELAGNGDPAAIDTCLPGGERIELIDRARGSRRVAMLDKGRLSAALFVSHQGALPARDWLISQLAEAQAHGGILAGRAPGVQVDRGAIVCACFDVGVRTIVTAIADQRLTSVGAIGKALGAGTNCGSCRPALARILAEHAPAPELLYAAE